MRNKNLRRWIDNKCLREINSDEEDEKGLSVDQSYLNDKFYLTRAAPLSCLRNRQVLINDYAFKHLEDEDGSDDGIGDVQLILPDKEEQLDQKALERIQSAQILGLKNVILIESEYDALENKKKRNELASVSVVNQQVT